MQKMLKSAVFNKMLGRENFKLHFNLTVHSEATRVRRIHYSALRRISSKNMH